MDEKEFDLLKKMASLEVENASLKMQVEELIKGADQLQVDGVYQAAKKKLYAWTASVFVVLTLFGFVSLDNIIEKIENQILAEGQERVISKLSEIYIQKYTDSITEGITGNLQPTVNKKIDEVFEDIKESTAKLVDAEVERHVREQLFATFRNVERSQDRQAPRYVEAVEKAYEEKRYWVIAASSVRRSDVVSELERVKRLVGPGFDVEFPDANIPRPYPGTNHHPLVLGVNLPYKAAEALRQKAIRAGFREDTFLWQARPI